MCKVYPSTIMDEEGRICNKIFTAGKLCLLTCISFRDFILQRGNRFVLWCEGPLKLRIDTSGVLWDSGMDWIEPSQATRFTFLKVLVLWFNV